VCVLCLSPVCYFVCARAVVANHFFVTICVRSKSGRLLASADDNGLVKVRPGAVVVNVIFFNVFLL
jgi:hypothetical protein